VVFFSISVVAKLKILVNFNLIYVICIYFIRIFFILLFDILYQLIIKVYTFYTNAYKISLAL